jgi:Tol biopolymer transport system component
MSRSAIWVVAGIALIVSLALPAAAMAVFPGENGKIAYVSGRGGAPNDDSSSDVFILNGPGDPNPTQLTFQPGQHRHPAWSPDLKTIAYARWNTANDEKIFLDDLDDPGPANNRLGISASNVRDDRPSWNPKGNKIAYESEVTDGSGQMDILVTNVKTNATINLTNTSNLIEGRPVWSLDGKTIYYSRRGLPPATDDDILSEPADNSGIPSSVLISATAEYQPALSPRGNAMCFTRGPFGSANADVFTLQPVDLFGSEVDLSDSSTGGYNCAYSPEGDKVAYVEGVFTNGALRFENSDDSGTSSLLAPDSPMHFDGNPDWAPKHPPFCKGKPATIARTDGPDEFKGTNERDVIAAFGAADVVRGRKGKDVICGGKGRDKLRGGPGKDKLFGEAGRDTLIGGPGKDKCVGGPGRDKKVSC